jgi:hypothetical protein
MRKKMPEWLTILLAVAGTLNVVGFVVWMVKSIYELKSRMGLLEAAQASIQKSCVLCDSDKREMFRTLKRLDRVNAAIAAKMNIDLSQYDVSE